MQTSSPIIETFFITVVAQLLVFFIPENSVNDWGYLEEKSFHFARIIDEVSIGMSSTMGTE